MSYKNFIAFVVTPLKIMEFFVILGGYDKGFYGIAIKLTGIRILDFKD